MEFDFAAVLELMIPARWNQLTESIDFPAYVDFPDTMSCNVSVTCAGSH